MKINQIILSEMATTAGSVASVARPMGEAQKRPKIAGLEPAEKVMSGKSKKKGPYANSLSEGAVKQLSMDLKGGKDGLTDEEFKKKYGKTKQEVRKEMQKKPEPVNEADLQEDDIIQMPGRGSKRKTGFVPRGQSRIDHEVEMARSDVLATMKNAKAIYELLKDRGEDEGLEGWVQEKLIKANDYLNSVKEYYDEKMMEQGAGVIAAGGVGEGVAEAGNKPVDRQFPLGTGDTRTPRELKTQMQGASDEFVKSTADKKTGPIHSRVAKMQGKLAKSELRRREQGVAEGAKVDRMVKHITSSEKKLGHNKKEAENIAWATANKRGMLDNKNKKAK